MEHEFAFRRYLELKSEIARLEAELEFVKSEVFYHVSEMGGRVAFQEIEFLEQYRKTYEYSESIQQMEKALKALKKNEEAQGVAVLKKMTGFVVAKSITPP
ncbi:MAG TPA: hypothetical protein DIW24_08410 [Bacteroidetes bacterium]|nr:hypothetical protein [Bacteroidota bacterium]